MISDPVSEWFFSFQNNIITYIGRFLDVFTLPIILFFIALLYGLKYFKARNKIIDSLKKLINFNILEKRLFTVLIALMLAVATVQFVKLIYPQDRPCSIGLSSEKIECPESSSFPSTHTVSAAVLLPFTLGTPLFLPAFIFCILVAFSRVYLGVHYLFDIIVAIALGIAIYFIVQKLLSKEKTLFASKSSNIFRAFSHLFFGLFVMLIIAVSYVYTTLPLFFAIVALFIFLIFLLFIIHTDLINKRISIFHNILQFISARDSFLGEGAILFVLGCIIFMGFVQDISQIIAGIYIITVGDVASAAFSSSKYRHRSFFKNKNIWSFSAFIISTLPVLLIVGIEFLPFLFLAALIESVDLKISDNLILFGFLTVVFTFLL